MQVNYETISSSSGIIEDDSRDNNLKQRSVNSDFQLLSPIIEFHPTGEYKFTSFSFLAPHEALRREFIRGDKALSQIIATSIQKENQWKFDAFYEWFVVFLLPIIEAHHHIEENILFGYYLNTFDIVTPESQSEDHITLIGRGNKVKRLLNNIIDFIKQNKFDEATIYLSNVLEAYQTLVKEMNNHFNDEEEYWPELIYQLGEENWKAAFALIKEEMMSFGDLNISDPYHLMFCSILNAMGYTFKDSSLPNDFLPWSNPEIGQRFIESFPIMVKFLKLPKWNDRYLKYQYLILDVADDRIPMKSKTRGHFVERQSKFPVHFIVWIMIPLYISFLLTPFFAAVYNPNSNLNRITIRVVDFDQSYIGDAFIKWLSIASTAIPNIPNFEFVNANFTSPDELKQKVLDGYVWGALYSTSDATSRLLNATSNGCAYTSSYNANNAIILVWDEGRNPQVADGLIHGVITGIIPNFNSYFALFFMRQMKAHSQANLQNCLTNNKENILISPIGYTSINLTPISVSPMSTSVYTLANIYTVVFAGIVFVSITYDATASYVENMTGIQRTLFRALSMSILDGSYGIVVSTITVCLSAKGSGKYLYSGNQWAQLAGKI